MDLDNSSTTTNNKQHYSKSLRLYKNEDINGEDALKTRLQQLEDQNAQLKEVAIKQNKKIRHLVDNNSKLISVISHDLKSPFNSISDILEILKRSLDNYNIDETNHLIDVAVDSTNKTLDLLNSLLTWAAFQNGTNTFNPVKINLYELIMTEVENFTTATELKNITLHQSITPDITVKADPQMVKSIIRNLISNAIKYTPKGGNIHVSAKVDESFIVIAVRDNGVGISCASQRNLFKKGSNNSTQGTQNEKGSGLGLLICKEFVDIHGGNILIESDNGNGEGAEFKFTLPHNK